MDVIGSRDWLDVGKGPSGRRIRLVQGRGHGNRWRCGWRPSRYLGWFRGLPGNDSYDNDGDYRRHASRGACFAIEDAPFYARPEWTEAAIRVVVSLKSNRLRRTQFRQAERNSNGNHHQNRNGPDQGRGTVAPWLGRFQRHFRPWLASIRESQWLRTH